MKTKMIAGTAAAVALMSGQAMAAPAVPSMNAASSLSISKSVRAGSPSKRGNKLAGPGAIIVAVLAAGAVAGAVIAITKDDNPDSN